MAPSTRASLVDTIAPALASGVWLQSPPLALDELGRSGRLTLLYFWAASSGRSHRILPELKALARHYGEYGLTVVGIHTPALPFERDHASLARALEDLEIPWPTLNDADHSTWEQFGSRAWPRLLLVAPNGRILYDQIGADDLHELETALRTGLHHLGRVKLPPPILTPHTHRMGTSCHPVTPDLQLSGHEVVPGQPFTTTFAGVGVDGVVAATSNGANRLQVRLNGGPVPASARGDDLIEQGVETVLVVDTPRLFHLIASPRYLAPGQLELQALDGPVELHRLEFMGCRSRR